jgi:hypothetical protein
MPDIEWRYVERDGVPSNSKLVLVSWCSPVGAVDIARYTGTEYGWEYADGYGMLYPPDAWSPMPEPAAMLLEEAP